jgi:hypothetical protein
VNARRFSESYCFSQQTSKKSSVNGCYSSVVIQIIALHNILKQLWCRWCCWKEVHLSLIPIIEWSNIVFCCWCWLGTPLQAAHVLGLAWLGLAWPGLDLRVDPKSQIFVYLKQPRYTSQARITQIAQNNIHSNTWFQFTGYILLDKLARGRIQKRKVCNLWSVTSSKTTFLL